MSHKMEYAVVRFVEPDEQTEVAEIVPCSWLLTDTEMYFPLNPNTNVTKEVMMYNDADPNWPRWEIEVLHKYASYALAKRALKVALEKTDIDTADGQTDLDKPRKRRKPSRFNDSEDSLEDVALVHRRKRPQIFSESESEAEPEHQSKLEAFAASMKQMISRKKEAAGRRQRQSRTSYPHRRTPNTSTPLTSKAQSAESLFQDGSNKENELAFDSSPTLFDAYVNSPPRNSQSNQGISRSVSHNGSQRTLSVSVNDNCLKPSNPQISNVGSKGKLSDGFSSDQNIMDVLRGLYPILKILTQSSQENSSKLDFLTSKVAYLQKLVKPEGEALVKPQGLPSYPLQSEEDFSTMENYLQDDSNFNLTFYYFEALIEGMEMSKTVNFLLKKIISNNLARIISFGGTGGSKLSFRNSRLFECMNCAIKKAFKSQVNLDVVKEKVQRWFVTSNQRKITAPQV